MHVVSISLTKGCFDVMTTHEKAVLLNNWAIFLYDEHAIIRQSYQALHEAFELIKGKDLLCEAWFKYYRNREVVLPIKGFKGIIMAREEFSDKKISTLLCLNSLFHLLSTEDHLVLFNYMRFKAMYLIFKTQRGEE